jgi:hypothetical protein
MIPQLIFPKNANYQIGNRDVVDQPTQTERGSETNIVTITYDEQMQLGAYIGQLEERLDKYKSEIQANLADYVEHIDEMTIRHMQEIKQLELWETINGDRWHDRKDCPAIAERNPRILTHCNRCGAGA